MRTGLQGLHLTPADEHADGRDATCHTTAATYPLDIPYMNGDNPLQGRTSRLVSILLTTIANTGACSYDLSTHHAILDRDFTTLCRKTGIYNGGNGLRRIRETLEAYAGLDFTDGHGNTVRPFDAINLPDRGLRGADITFTPGYATLMTTGTRQVKASTLARIRTSGVALDMLMLALFYAPDDRRLLIRIPDLRRLLPTSEGRLLEKTVIARTAERLNQNQTEWRFSCADGLLRIQPAGLRTNSGDDMLLEGIA